MNRSTLPLAALALVACANSDYDPNLGHDGLLGDAPRGNLLDFVPELTFEEARDGDVGGERLEIYAMRLRNGDQVRLTMEVTDGDLNPHVLLYRGTSYYVEHDRWSLEGSGLEKDFTVDETATYVVVARAYEEVGEGSYTLRAECLGGPCNGDEPPPDDEPLETHEVGQCIEAARACAFEYIERWNGSVGPARARTAMSHCLNTVTVDRSSCAAACDFDEDATEYCDSVIASIPFYADRSAECLGALDLCMSDCVELGEDTYPDEVWWTPEALCWHTGFNNTCDQYARQLTECGGTMQPETGRECYQRCEAVQGAHVDDLDTLCNEWPDCEDYCPADLALAIAHCGAFSLGVQDCLFDWMEDDNGYHCTSTLEERLDSLPEAAECAYSIAPPFELDTSAALRAHATSRREVSSYRYDVMEQILAAFVHLEYLDGTEPYRELFDLADEETVIYSELVINGVHYDWVEFYRHSTESGVIFAHGTNRPVAEVNDGDIRGCR